MNVYVHVMLRIFKSLKVVEQIPIVQKINKTSRFYNIILDVSSGSHSCNYLIVKLEMQ